MVLGGGQTCPKYLKQEIGNIFAIYQEKHIAIAFRTLFYCYAKQIFQRGSLMFDFTC